MHFDYGLQRPWLSKAASVKIRFILWRAYSNPGISFIPTDLYLSWIWLTSMLTLIRTAHFRISNIQWRIRSRQIGTTLTLTRTRNFLKTFWNIPFHFLSLILRVWLIIKWTIRLPFKLRSRFECKLLLNQRAIMQLHWN